MCKTVKFVSSVINLNALVQISFLMQKKSVRVTDPVLKAAASALVYFSNISTLFYYHYPQVLIKKLSVFS